MTKFKRVNYLRQGESLNYDYSLVLPEPLASWDVFDYWERERVESMRDNLTKNDTLFDVGAEHGWMSIVFAKMCKVFLIEPTKEFWPNIYETWKANERYTPIGCYSGLLSNKTDDKKDDLFNWPKECRGELIDKNKYEYIDQNSGDIKQMKLDDLVKRSGIVPTALTIDVEGSEFEVLKGSKVVIKKHHPKIWLSIHPNLMLERHGHIPKQIKDFLESRGYKGKHLVIDHEEHWFYTTKNT